MRNIKLILIFIILIFTVSLCRSPKEIYKLQGSTKINDSLYFDNYEVDLKAWLSFYTWTQENKGIAEANKLLPDSNSIDIQIWHFIKAKSSDYNEELSILTGQPIGYFNKHCESCKNCDQELSPNGKKCPLYVYPITGVSYEQVVEFCSWRTKIQGENKIIFRLPTEKEWKEIVYKGFSKTEIKNACKDSINNEHCQLYNYNGHKGSGSILHTVGRYKPDGQGLYDLFGNVSEMTLEKGISKGGNYLLYANQSQPDKIQKYSKPEKWLGFRCVRIIKK